MSSASQTAHSLEGGRERGRGQLRRKCGTWRATAEPRAWLEQGSVSPQTGRVETGWQWPLTDRDSLEFIIDSQGTRQPSRAAISGDSLPWRRGPRPAVCSRKAAAAAAEVRTLRKWPRAAGRGQTGSWRGGTDSKKGFTGHSAGNHLVHFPGACSHTKPAARAGTCISPRNPPWASLCLPAGNNVTLRNYQHSV